MEAVALTLHPHILPPRCQLLSDGAFHPYHQLVKAEESYDLPDKTGT